MTKYLLGFFALLALAACNKDEPTDMDTDGYEGHTLIWSDEFNATFNSDNWTYEIGDGTAYGLPPGWGNAERQLYTETPSNSIIRADGDGNSVLAISAKVAAGDNRYSSAKLTTQNLQSFRFGRVEARIKVPQGQGLWPAFWMLGDNFGTIDWPGCGEIDIMEVIGHEPNVVHSTVHYTNSDNKLTSNGLGHDALVNLSEDYHIYRVDWTPEELVFSLDGNETHRVAVEEDMKEFLRSFYIVFNLAVGGSWPGNPDATTEFPAHLLIDWVRVYEKNGLNAPAEPTLNIQEETLGAISPRYAPMAFNGSLGQFSDLVIKSFGAGGEPEVIASANAVDGDSSLLLRYPGTNWGGVFFELDPTVDWSEYATGNLKFSLHAPLELADMELKLESVATAHSLFLKDYQGMDIGNGFKEYSIPVSDFADLDLTDLKIPFALWNPKDATDEYFPVEVLLDNVYFER